LVIKRFMCRTFQFVQSSRGEWVISCSDEHLANVVPAASALDREAAITALKTVGDQLGLDTIAMAEGICDVANFRMALAIPTLVPLAEDDPRRVLRSQQLREHGFVQRHRTTRWIHQLRPI
jgi:hypothetical protein